MATVHHNIIIVTYCASQERKKKRRESAEFRKNNNVPWHASYPSVCVLCAFLQLIRGIIYG